MHIVSNILNAHLYKHKIQMCQLQNINQSQNKEYT